MLYFAARARAVKVLPAGRAIMQRAARVTRTTILIVFGSK
jgi:hypothetical protein